MSILLMPIHGSLHIVENQAILLLDKAGSQFFLAFSIQERRSEQEIFPESLLDDWGHEIDSLDLYDWIQEHGQDFPRAEIFGYDWNGDSHQLFIREIDLLGEYPCYLYHDHAQNINQGINLSVIAIPDSQVGQPEQFRGKSLFEYPLGNAMVRWWLINPDDIPQLARIPLS